jgi:hypothetical protein
MVICTADIQKRVKKSVLLLDVLQNPASSTPAR